jgi:hypothetical protein
MLVNDGTEPYSRFAPTFASYRPESPDYAVEAKIRVIQDRASSFGVVVRARANEGYAVGVGGFWGRTTNICYLDGWWGTNDRANCIAAGQAFDPGTDWHTYRIEVKANVITLLIDNAVMTSVTDNRFLSAGLVGLWSNRYHLEVLDFKIIKLTAVRSTGGCRSKGSVFSDC